MVAMDDSPLDAQIHVLQAYVTDLLAQTEAAGRATERLRSLAVESRGPAGRELAAAVTRLDRIASTLCESAADLKALTARFAARAGGPRPPGSTRAPRA